MPKYGIGIYVFDSNHQLYLVKKTNSAFSKGRMWLVPGTTFDDPWELKSDKEQDEILRKILEEETPVPERTRDLSKFQCVSIGSWTHSLGELNFRFENLVLTYPEVFGSLKNGGQISDTNITGRPFSVSALPIPDMSDLTKDFFRSSLFHSSTHIPSPANDDVRGEFSEYLGDEAKKYFLFKALGQGGYGRVYSVLDIATLLPRVIKVPLENISDNTWLDRFLIEGKALLTLIHKKVQNVEEILSINRIDDTHYYLLKKFINGNNLQNCFRQITGLQIPNVIAAIVKTLKEVHKLEIVHRDLKPNNIMIEFPEGGRANVTIIDFGLAKDVQNDFGANRHLTREGDRPGSAYYQSLVTFNDYRRHTWLDDYYSVLQIYYLLLSKRVFYEGFYSNMPTGQVKQEVMKCKGNKRDPFFDNGLASITKGLRQDDVIKFGEFYNIVKQAYSENYDISKDTVQPKDMEQLKEKLCAVEEQIAKVFE